MTGKNKGSLKKTSTRLQPTSKIPMIVGDPILDPLYNELEEAGTELTRVNKHVKKKREVIAKDLG